MPELQETGKYRIVRVGNFSGKDEWFYSDMELEDNKYCESGDLLYKWACNFGPEIWNEEKVIYHYHIWKVIPNKNNMKKMFLYHLLNFSTPQWLGGTNGTAMVHITKDIGSLTSFYPMQAFDRTRVLCPRMPEIRACCAHTDFRNGVFSDAHVVAKKRINQMKRGTIYGNEILSLRQMRPNDRHREENGLPGHVLRRADAGDHPRHHRRGRRKARPGL